MSKQSYAEKLKDPRWQKRRLQILDRDEFKCQLCGDTQTELHVHHEMYFKDTEPWDYGDELLTTHCKQCHAVATMLDKMCKIVAKVEKIETNNGNYLFFACAIRDSEVDTHIIFFDAVKNEYSHNVMLCNSVLKQFVSFVKTNNIITNG